MKKGSKHSEQTKQKMREKKLGKKRDEQTKSKISTSMKEYFKDNEEVRKEKSKLFKRLYSILKERKENKL